MGLQLEFFSYKNGIYKSQSKQLGIHSIVIIGYGPGYWLI